ncbi:MAG: acetyl-CoA carboxylase biotin carboxyl carrier protein [Sphingobacteriales bacterium]|nr:MAG: acetyl-CoA carboxylase biotin carboxyl carrier protein [Sphingobacteriales bacterium]
MEYKQIQELIKAINKSNISELSIEEGDFKITIKQAQNVSETQFVAVQAPMPMAMQSAPAPQAISAPQPVAGAQPAAGGDTSNGNYITVKSPMIGTFYRSSSPDKPAFVNVGDEIKQGQVLCIIEAMKLFNEIESEVSGKIVKVLIDDASPVEYDQPLFLVEP